MCTVCTDRPHLPWIVTPASLAANPLPDPDDDPPPNAAAPVGAPAIGWTFSDELEAQYSFNETTSRASGGGGGDPESRHQSWAPYDPLLQSQTAGFPAAWTRELRQYYKAAVTHTDSMIGGLLEGLDTWHHAHGGVDNTIIALWGE